MVRYKVRFHGESGRIITTEKTWLTKGGAQDYADELNGRGKWHKATVVNG